MAGEEDSSLSSSGPAVQKSEATAATELLNALQAKRKTGFVNGMIRKPPVGDPNFENWTAANSMIVGWIRSSIEPKVKSIVSFISDAHLLWEELKQRFSVGNKVRVHQLKAELASCRQNGQPVLEYFGRLSKLWEDYQIYKSIKACTCGLCVCGLVHEAAKEREEKKIHQFVLGLDDSRFGGVSQNIISMDPMPSLIESESSSIVGLSHRENQIVIKSDSLSRSGGGRGLGGRGRGGRGSSFVNSGRGRGQIVAAHATSSNLSAFTNFTQDQPPRDLAYAIPATHVTG
ncbi:unnamed protein product [Arabidopsis halleri]